MSTNTVDVEYVEGETLEDDASEKQPLPGKSPTRPDRTAKAGSRTGRAALGPKAPQDHKRSQASLAAARREALDAEGRLSIEVNEETFTFDPDHINIGFQLKCERGTPALACLQLFGPEAMEQVESWPVTDLELLINAAVEAAGLGNS